MGPCWSKFEPGSRLYVRLVGSCLFFADKLCISNVIAQNVYYRRTRRQDINLITDIRLLPEKEQPEPLDGWHQAHTSLRAGVLRIPPLFIWYKTGKTAGQMTPEEKAHIITELDVIYGEDVPWYGFEKLEPATLPEKGRVEATWLTYRRGVKGLTAISSS